MTIDDRLGADRTAAVTERGLFISGAWVPASSQDTLSLTDPATEEEFGSAAVASDQDVDAAVASARRAFDSGPWPRMTLHERAAALERFADALEADIEPLADLVLRETGLPYRDSVNGIRAMLAVVRYYAELAGGRAGVGKTTVGGGFGTAPKAGDLPGAAPVLAHRGCHLLAGLVRVVGVTLGDLCEVHACPPKGPLQGVDHRLS
ncbi:aldehyde dehydrogenase family protein [Streptomyces sp. NPDC088847]|uniref:aldehyde dehydrogenase family protein n=1 Tax=Streptomyces sp. NPDC088847 TaxID=3365909 RepID=UPI003804DF1A